MGAIDLYIADLQQKYDLYRSNWAIPYGSAFAQARAAYDQTITAQAERDKFRAELLMTVMTIGMGAGLGAMFGKTAFRTVAVNSAVNFVCNRNMVRTFNAIAAVNASIPGTFIVDQAWSFIEGKISEGAKTLVQGMVNQPATSVSAVAVPQVFQNDLENYVLRAKTAAYQVAADIRDNASMSAAEKDTAAVALRNSVFFRNAPITDVIGNRDRAAQAIELGFYMPMIMDADYITETYADPDTRIGGRGLVEVRRIGPVTQSTNAADYPRWGTGLGVTPDGSIRSIAYDRPGSTILDRVNTLYQARFNSQFIANGWFDGGFGAADITRAEQTMERLNQQVLAWRPVQ